MQLLLLFITEVLTSVNRLRINAISFMKKSLIKIVVENCISHQETENNTRDSKFFVKIIQH